MNECSVCHIDFGSVAAFDAHRVGKHEYLFREGLEMEPPREDGRRCLDEEEIEAAVNSAGSSIYARNAHGKWSLAGSVKSGARGFSVATIKRAEGS